MAVLLGVPSARRGHGCGMGASVAQAIRQAQRLGWISSPAPGRFVTLRLPDGPLLGRVVGGYVHRNEARSSCRFVRHPSS